MRDKQPVACRGLVMPGATAWLDAPLPNSSIEQWRMVVIVTGYKLFVTSHCDVIQVCNQCFVEVCWHNMHISRRRSRGKAGGAVKHFRAMETYEKQKIVINNVCFCSSTMLTPKIITEIIENHSEFSGCSKSCNDYVSSRSWKTTKSYMILLWETVVLVGGGDQAFFYLLKIWSTSLKIRVEMAPNLAWLQKMAPEVCRKSHEDPFRRSHQIGLHDLCGRAFVGKSYTKAFRESLGKFGQKSFAHQKFPCS